MEIWEAISGKLGYMVSSEGRVASTRGILAQEKCKDGYRRVNIQGKKYMVHRLVAQAFLPNPEHLPQVNHIDEVRCNNSVRNLQWVSISDNLRHGHHSEHVLTGHRLSDSPKSTRAIMQYTLDGHFVNAFRSINEASRMTGVTTGHITSAAKKIRKSAGGFRWEYINSVEEFAE